MFKSKKKRDFLFYIKELFWPTMGWKRAAKYIALRIMRLSVTSDSVPRGFACGITASFFPVFGVHALMAMGMALIMRANVIAAALGTLVFPPIILPLLFSFDFWIGERIIKWTGLEVLPALSADTDTTIHTMHKLEQFFIPAMTGSLLMMVLVWPTAYYLIHKALHLLRVKHQRKKQE